MDFFYYVKKDKEQNVQMTCMIELYLLYALQCRLFTISIPIEVKYV